MPPSTQANQYILYCTRQSALDSKVSQGLGGFSTKTVDSTITVSTIAVVDCTCFGYCFAWFYNSPLITRSLTTVNHKLLVTSIDRSHSSSAASKKVSWEAPSPSSGGVIVLPLPPLKCLSQGQGGGLPPLNFFYRLHASKKCLFFCQSRHLQSRANCPANSKYVNL